MTKVYQTIKESYREKPDLSLFRMRSILFIILYVFTEVFYLAQKNTLPSWKWFLFFNVKTILLIFIFYNIFYWTCFNRLGYELDNDSLKIRLFFRKKTIPYGQIKSIQKIKEPINIKPVNLFSYLKEFPQIVHYIAQHGKFVLNGTKDVYFYSTIDSVRNPKNLIVITTCDEKQYYISPESTDDFIQNISALLELSNSDHS